MLRIRTGGLKSVNKKLWVFWILDPITNLDTVTSWFFGRFPERSKARKINLSERKNKGAIRSGYSNDTNDFKFYHWPDTIEKPNLNVY